MMKKGKKIGLTVGRVNEVLSVSRYISGYSEPLATREWVILPYKHSDLFRITVTQGHLSSTPRGLLTGGSGVTDMSYATPMESLLKNMEEAGFHNPNPNVGQQK